MRTTLLILLIEDDAETADYVASGLLACGHSVSISADGRAGLRAASEGPWNLLIIDRRLPYLDGLSLLRTLRAAGTETPALFLTTMGAIGDRITGLRAGGDDYLVKPFALAELAARVEALVRRTPAIASGTLLRVADLEMDLLAREVRRRGQEIALQAQEFRLLEYLMRHAGQVVTRTMLLENVWGFNFDPRTNVVDGHISRLRSKLHQDDAPELINTVRGAGYCMRVS